MIKVIIAILLIVFTFVVGFCMGASWIFNRKYKIYKKQSKIYEKYCRMFNILNLWVGLFYNGIRIEQYFEKYNFYKIAIYGMGHLGKHLLNALKESQIKVEYIIDKRSDVIESNIQVYNPDQGLPQVDVIVVTAIIDFGIIADMLETKVECPIVSLEEIICEENSWKIR
jgi:uncharacterized protein YneF (UPF0154 family)